MRQAVRRWLFSVGTVMAVGMSVMGQSPIAAASPTASRGSAVPAASRGSAVPAAPAAYVPANRVLKVGMHGAAVRALQQRLSELKYYPGKIDGSFGQHTI